jgi:hypothetical protein
VAVVVAALIAGGALLTATQLRQRTTPATTRTSTPPASSGVGVDGCAVEPCQVLATARVAGTRIELVADRGARSGRLRIGGPTSSDVIEMTITDMGVKLTREALQCVAGTLSACVVRGGYKGGTAGQVVVGRSGKWSSLTKPFVADAGYLALSDITVDSGPEVVTVQHDCAGAAAGCVDTPVFARVFALDGTEAGCTGTYPSVTALPSYPEVELSSGELAPCG